MPANQVMCLLCPKHCTLQEYERGDCRVRVNVGGELHTLIWGQSCSANIDPIEKKPLFHFLPASWAFSIATAGSICTANFVRTGKFLRPILRIPVIFVWNRRKW